MRTLGVIPARGGSKGIPRKNLAPLGGVPLLLHTIRAAQGATLLDCTVVSTDDDEIARVAREAGAEVVERPSELAADDTPTEDALIHAVETVGSPEFVVTLEPTSPLRTARLIDECIAAALEGADAVVTVAETRDVLGRVVDGRFEHLEPGQPRRRQLREALYRELSTVYVTRTRHLLERRSVLADGARAVVVPDEEALDVNTDLDLAVAEALLRRRSGGG